MSSETWKTAIIEGSMVLVGVLLALFVDSWREDLEFRDLVEVTEARIVEEIASNRDRLTSYREDFVERQEQLVVWGGGLDLNRGILYQLESFPGIPSTFINRSAWSMANNSQITEYIDHEFYDEAFQLYANGEALEGRLDIALEIFFDVQGFDENFTDPLYEVLKLYFNDIISNLNSLIRDHGQFLEKFGPET